MKVAYLAVGALGVDRVLEGVEDLLKSQGLVRFAIGDLPHVTVGTRADLFEEVVAGQNVGLDLLSHSSFLLGILNIISMECSK